MFEMWRMANIPFPDKMQWIEIKLNANNKIKVTIKALSNIHGSY
jgi:hypothetical protein